MNKKYLKNIYFLLFAISIFACFTAFIGLIFDTSIVIDFETINNNTASHELLKLIKAFDITMLTGICVFIVISLLAFIFKNFVTDIIYTLFVLTYAIICIVLAVLLMEETYKTNIDIVAEACISAITLIFCTMIISFYRTYKLFSFCYRKGKEFLHLQQQKRQLVSTFIDDTTSQDMVLDITNIENNEIDKIDEKSVDNATSNIDNTINVDGKSSLITNPTHNPNVEKEKKEITTNEDNDIKKNDISSSDNITPNTLAMENENVIKEHREIKITKLKNKLVDDKKQEKHSKEKFDPVSISNKKYHEDK